MITAFGIEVNVRVTKLGGDHTLLASESTSLSLPGDTVDVFQEATKSVLPELVEFTIDTAMQLADAEMERLEALEAAIPYLPGLQKEPPVKRKSRTTKKG